jgi:hypothetical protein
MSKRRRADGDRQGTVEAGRRHRPGSPFAQGRGHARPRAHSRVGRRAAMVDSPPLSGTLIGLQLPVFAMDFPKDPSSGSRGDSALNSGRTCIERKVANARTESPVAPSTGHHSSLRIPLSIPPSMRDRVAPVKMSSLLQREATRIRRWNGPTAYGARASSARLAVHRMDLGHWYVACTVTKTCLHEQW